MEDERQIVVVAGDDDWTAAGLCAAAIGADVRFYLDDGKGGWDKLLFGVGVGAPILMGLDLAPGPELVSIKQMPFAEFPKPLRDFQRTHPTTARELRRAERRRKR